ncbi:hypothetical protein TIFTF001_017511 [Ficus carica]|uniref:MULE transposase domain-containing protein n=1 Tax=Ficus carica TaxID=3494 RepID=A0AA88A9M6_FICCA|nr:hypothetical protein TIFTF001_017511 [Ficus carica]
MTAVCIFIKYNGHWDGTLRYAGGEMKGILVPLIATYVGLIELMRSVIGIKGLDKTIVMRYAVEPEMPPVRIQCDADVNFYIQLKKKDAHVLSKFPISIDVLDESVAEAIPPEVGESNHIDMQPSRDGGQSDEAMQPVAVNNLIIPSCSPPYIPSPTVGLDLHMKDGIEEQHELLNNDLSMDHDDCNAGELNVADAARDSNKKSIVDEFGVSFNYLRAWQGKEAALTSLRGDDAESYKAASKQGWPHCHSRIVVDGLALKVTFGGMMLAACGHDTNGSIFPLTFGIVPSETNESWKWFFEKLRDSTGTRESLAIVADRHKSIEYAANIIYPDADFGVMHSTLGCKLEDEVQRFQRPYEDLF